MKAYTSPLAERLMNDPEGRKMMRAFIIDPENNHTFTLTLLSGKKFTLRFTVLKSFTLK